jgi:uncharacterized membrane protein YdjX (TVP38/TMEM64 family)
MLFRAQLRAIHPPIPFMHANRLIPDNVVWRRAVLLLAACVALAMVASSAALHDALLDVLTVIEKSIKAYPFSGAVLFVVFAALSAMIAFLSVVLVVPAAVVAWGEPVSMVLLWLGWMLGGALSYGVGRGFGRRAVRWFIASDTLLRFEHRVKGNAPCWLVLLLQLALPSEIPGYLLGLAKYPLGRYLLVLGIAELPYTLATVHLGAGFVERRSGIIVSVGISIACVSVVAVYLLRRVLR